MSPPPGGNQPIIIVKRRGGHGHGHHGGAWKVAYADFVTAMMAFFLVMWIVGQSKATKAAVAGYFRDPVAFEQAQGAGSGILPGVQSGATGGGQPVTPSDVQSARAALEKAAEHLREKLANTPNFDKLKDRVDISVTDEGLRIELREAPDDGFFDTGSAAMKPITVTLLAIIAEELSLLENKVAIEGHTDRTPYGRGQKYTNWELSADRANAARRVLEEKGLREAQVDAVRGYADTRPRTPDKPFDAGNRRISIVVRQGPGDPTTGPQSAPRQAASPTPASSSTPAAKATPEGGQKAAATKPAAPAH
jgi:chemotaxis protein MotB